MSNKSIQVLAPYELTLGKRLNGAVVINNAKGC